MLQRSEANPILEPQPNLDWCSQKVYNPAVIKEGSTYKMLFRAVGDDWVSRLGLATSENGIDFVLAPMPSLAPKRPWESMGCEDPRLVQLNKTYYLCYTGFDGTTARAALATSRNLKRWKYRGLLLPGWQANPRAEVADDWSKSAAIFPQNFQDRYYLFFGDSHVWSAESHNLRDWRAHNDPVLSRRPGYFDEGYVEMGPPPLLTDRGWLVFYHGIDRTDAERTYYLGAALFRSDDPLKLIWRCTQPVMAPSEAYERSGLIDVIEGGFATLKNLSVIDLEALAHQHRLPKAVFCCSALLENDLVRFYYGAGDTVICTATMDLDSIFKL